MDPANVVHQAKSVESLFYSVSNVGDLGRNFRNAYGNLQCLTTEEIVDPEQGQLMRTNRRLIYPCNRAARIDTWDAPSIRNPATLILKGACYGPAARVLRMLVRTFSPSSCMRAITAVPHLLMHVDITPITRIIPSHPGRIAPEPPHAANLVIKDFNSVINKKDIDFQKPEDSSFTLDDPLVGHGYEICVHNFSPRFDFWLTSHWVPIETSA